MAKSGDGCSAAQLYVAGRSRRPTRPSSRKRRSQQALCQWRRWDGSPSGHTTTCSVRALARWAAASVPPGALVADGVAVVLDRLGDGDPDALAAQVMTEAPNRFGRNWESGPAH